MNISPHRPAALAIAAAMLIGCGTASGASGEAASGGKAKVQSVTGVGLVRAGSTAQFADCADWRRGTVHQRRVTITSIRDQLTPQRSATAESALSDDAAYRIFDKTCSSGIANSLRLYKLYARAQTFAGLAPQTRDSDT